MSKQTSPAVTEETARRKWDSELEDQIAENNLIRNRSGIAIKPLYTPDDWETASNQDKLGYPGQYPLTRGIHASMYRGRPWSQRLVVGLGLPEDYNKRMRALYNDGAEGLYVAPCNSHMRGFDANQVDPELLGTCGTVINTIDDFEICLSDLPIESQSLSLGDTAPFTLSAMLLALAKKRDIPWDQLRGTTNQSDYLSHLAALHMFFRLSLPGARRLLLDHVEFMAQHAPKWNGLSVVGQHIQQAGATPAEAMALTLCSAIQHVDDLTSRGLDPDAFLPRISFFFDISISFFEEIAKFRAGRRIWSRITNERFKARDPRSWRMRFHGQTSGADLTRQQPMNNITRVAIQAMAGVFGGLQSLHTDAYDEAIASPSEDSARIAINTQNILREEAHLDQVIDPLGGSFYIETLTDEMEAQILSIMEKIEEAGGMYKAVETGVVQEMIGRSAMSYQNEMEAGQQKQIGVNAYQQPGEGTVQIPTPQRLSEDRIADYLCKLEKFKATRNSTEVEAALKSFSKSFTVDGANTFEGVVKAVEAGATHGEICQAARDAVGAGQPNVSF